MFKTTTVALGYFSLVGYFGRDFSNWLSYLTYRISVSMVSEIAEAIRVLVISLADALYYKCYGCQFVNGDIILCQS